MFYSLGKVFEYKWQSKGSAYSHIEIDIHQAIHWAWLAAKTALHPSQYIHPKYQLVSKFQLLYISQIHILEYTSLRIQITYEEPTITPVQLDVEPCTKPLALHRLCLHHKYTYVGTLNQMLISSKYRA